MNTNAMNANNANDSIRIICMNSYIGNAIN